MKHDTLVPRHVAIIMDGNRRWAREHNLPPLEGHRRVAHEVLEKLVEYAAKLGIRYITLWAWSTENWGRKASEVAGIMRILRMSLTSWGEKAHKKGIRILVIGDLTKFDSQLQHDIQRIVERTGNNRRMTIVFALNYGGRDELIRAIHKIPLRHYSTITAKQFNNYLDTAGIPDPEFIIRTGGEQRLSGFLLWQSEYSELYFPSWYMPDFTPARLDEALKEFAKRKRRFGV